VKVSQIGTTLALADFFTPYNQQYLSDNDQDLNDGVLLLPDQPGAFPHEAIAEGKEGTIYVLNRDNLGQFCSTCTTGDAQIVQEIPGGAGKKSGTPVYWNNTVYFTGMSYPVKAFSLNNGTLTVPASVQSAPRDGGGHALITANGNSNGILWFINAGSLWALDAITLNTLYNSTLAANGRDTLPPLAHFATPIAADGKVFIGTQNSVVVYGLLSGSAALLESQSNMTASSPPPPLQAPKTAARNAISTVAVGTIWKINLPTSRKTLGTRLVKHLKVLHMPQNQHLVRGSSVRAMIPTRVLRDVRNSSGLERWRTPS
jgi:outer membrane protein assembly factor BamB